MFETFLRALKSTLEFILSPEIDAARSINVVYTHKQILVSPQSSLIKLLWYTVQSNELNRKESFIHNKLHINPVQHRILLPLIVVWIREIFTKFIHQKFHSLLIINNLWLPWWDQVESKRVSVQNTSLRRKNYFRTFVSGREWIAKRDPVRMKITRWNGMNPIHKFAERAPPPPVFYGVTSADSDGHCSLYF